MMVKQTAHALLVAYNAWLRKQGINFFELTKDKSVFEYAANLVKVKERPSKLAGRFLKSLEPIKSWRW